MRRAHPGWAEEGGLGDCKVPRISTVPSPRRCGFCDRTRFYARDWAHRCNHIARHFKAGANMDQWRDWPEDEPEEDDARPDDSDQDDDDDDDNQGDDGGLDKNDNRDQPHGSPPPPDNDTNEDHDRISGQAPGGWSPTLDEFLHPWNIFSFGRLSSNSTAFPLTSLQDSNDTQDLSRWTSPIISQELISSKGSFGEVFKITIHNSHSPEVCLFIQNTSSKH
jgi:hypothetical protein